MKIRPVGAELFHADRLTDGQTGMTKLIVPKIFKGIFGWRVNFVAAIHVQARGC
jgi:hypothetical protein